MRTRRPMLKALGEVNEGEPVRLPAADFSIGGTFVKSPSRNLLICGVEARHLKTERSGSRFQLLENPAAESLALKVRVYPHASDLTFVRGTAKESSHPHQLAADEADQKVTAGVEVVCPHITQVVLPRPVATMHPGVLKHHVMELPHCLRVPGLERAQLDRTHLSPRISILE